jgi:hypothetical protein
MPRPDRVNDEIKSPKLKSNQSASIREFLDSLSPDTDVSSRIALLKEYLMKKNVPFKGITQDSFMGQTRIAVHMLNTSYHFAVRVN